MSAVRIAHHTSRGPPEYLRTWSTQPYRSCSAQEGTSSPSVGSIPLSSQTRRYRYRRTPANRAAVGRTSPASPGAVRQGV